MLCPSFQGVKKMIEKLNQHDPNWKVIEKVNEIIEELNDKE